MKQYILNGHEAVPAEDLSEWARWLETSDRVVRVFNLNKRVSVSTVFLGIDHSFSVNGPPLLFETLVFGGPLDGEMSRCATWDEAVRQHCAAVAAVMESDRWWLVLRHDFRVLTDDIDILSVYRRLRRAASRWWRGGWL